MAIKNFKTPENKDTTPKEEKFLVSDYMVPQSKLIVFSPDQKLAEAMEVLVQKGISGAPVLLDGKLVGIISEGDCMKKIANSRYYNIPLNDQTVKDYMASNVDVIHPSMNIFDAANLFCTANRKRFPVVKDGLVVGQISRHDILKAALEI